MSVEGLSGDGEYNLINLLKALIAHDPTGNCRVKSLYLFPHPAVQREYAYIAEPRLPETMRALGYLRIVQRNLFIVHALYGILDAHAGTPPVALPVDSPTLEHAILLGPQCYTCRALILPGVVPGDTRRLQKCSGCKLVSYCSSACQKLDWASHKKICRNTDQPFDPKHLTPPPAPRKDFIGCPAPEPGFLRSQALWRQIGWLSKPDSYTRDYHFDMASGRTRSIRILHPTARSTFLVARRRAMASGDVRAVHKMHEILNNLIDEFGVTPAQLTAQLEREYRTGALGRANAAQLSVAAGLDWYGPLPSEEEMLEEMRYAARRDALVPPEDRRPRLVQAFLFLEIVILLVLP
ncbi:hypothetical protein C8J57DRAFT_1735195 [Mycena rebaudengoi]|nr:hypothetical protein C8J57DRAFT_1735195 [Mycena rebaudengoi]